MESRHNAKFVVIGATTGCLSDYLRCHQWRQNWHHGKCPCWALLTWNKTLIFGIYAARNKLVYLDSTLVFDILICLKLIDAHYKQILWF